MHIALVRDLHILIPLTKLILKSTPKSELKCNFWGAIEVIMQLGFLFNLRALQKLVKGRK